MRDAGRAGNRAQMREVDARCREPVDDQVMEEVVSHAADEARACTGATGRDGLIRALAPQHEGELVAEDRLASGRQAPGEGGHIGRDAADDDDAGAVLGVCGGSSRS